MKKQLMPKRCSNEPLFGPLKLLHFFKKKARVCVSGSPHLIPSSSPSLPGIVVYWATILMLHECAFEGGGDNLILMPKI